MGERILNRFLFIIFGLLFFILSFPFSGFHLSFAQQQKRNLKIAYVDISKVIQEAEAAQEAKRKLQGEYERKQAELKRMQDEILKIQDDFMNKVKFMSQQEADKKRAEIEAKQNEFMQKLRQAELEIQNLDAKLTQGVIEDIRKIVEKIAQKDGYDIVLEKNQIIYVKDADDITFRIIDEYNKSWRKEKEKRERK
jgi:outer membrane protein